MLTLMRKTSVFILALLILVGCSAPVEEVPTEPEVPKRHEIRFTVAEASYTLPTPFSNFSDNGWIIDLDENFIVPAQSYIEQQAIRRDKFYMRLTFYNNTDEDLAIKDTIVVSVQAEDRYVKDHYIDEMPSDIVLDPNIAWGLTQEEAASQYGTTATIEEDKVYISYVYELETNQRIGLRYRKDDGELQFIEMKDFGPNLQLD